MNVNDVLKELGVDKTYSNRVQVGDREIDIKKDSVTEKTNKGSWSFNKTKKGE